MVTAFYLWRRGKPVLFVLIPMLLLLIMPAWAMSWQMFNPNSGWLRDDPNYLLGGIGLAVVGLQIWMIIEGIVIWRPAKGVLEESLPPLAKRPALDGGRSC
jgi:carbon starvation protein